MPNDDLADFGNSIFSIADSTPQKNQVKLRKILDGGSDEFSGNAPEYYRNKFKQIKILDEYLQENIINESSPTVIDKIKKLKLEVKNQDNSLLYTQKNFAEN